MEPIFHQFYGNRVCCRYLVSWVLSCLVLVACHSRATAQESQAEDTQQTKTAEASESSWQTASALAVEAERRRFAAEMKALAAKARELKMPAEAKVAESQIIRFDPERQIIFMPSGMVRPPKETQQPTPSEWTDAQKSFDKRLKTLKQEFAANLFELVPKRVYDEEAAAAYQLLHEVLVYNPQHKEARRILGFRNDEKLGWIRSAKATRASKGTTARKLVGWKKGTYWTIYSPHFIIYSAAGEEAGLRLARELELTYWVWRQVFFEYQSGTRQISEWLNTDRSDPFSGKQYKVYLFRDRQQYLSDMSAVPNVEISTGYYDDQAEASFFYPGENNDVSTWRHETVHQLLQENSRSNIKIRERGQAWLVEGVAMYFETMKVHDDYVVLGGFDAYRLQFARRRCKREGFFIPMAMLDAMTNKELQSRSDAGRIYSQSAGVAQMLMASKQGKYRNKFVRYVRQFYREKRTKLTLAEQTMALDQLDRHYQRFLDVSTEQVRTHFSDPATDHSAVRALALGGCGLCDADVALLAKCTKLDWLQLSENPALTDDALKSLDEMKQLTELFLDVTAITDAAAPYLARMKSLQEIDVASTRITDATVAQLAELPELRFLYLAKTKVTDECIDSLVQIPKLSVVDLRKTEVTTEAIQRLEKARPDLEVVK